jgi:hypothetical protein
MQAPTTGSGTAHQSDQVAQAQQCPAASAQAAELPAKPLWRIWAAAPRKNPNLGSSTRDERITAQILHIAESGLQPHHRRDGGGLGAQDAGS